MRRDSRALSPGRAPSLSRPRASSGPLTSPACPRTTRAPSIGTSRTGFETPGSKRTPVPGRPSSFMPHAAARSNRNARLTSKKCVWLRTWMSRSPVLIDVDRHRRQVSKHFEVFLRRDDLAGNDGILEQRLARRCADRLEQRDELGALGEQRIRCRSAGSSP